MAADCGNSLNQNGHPLLKEKKELDSKFWFYLISKTHHSSLSKMSLFTQKNPSDFH